MSSTKKSYRNYTISVSLRFAENDVGHRTPVVEVSVNDERERQAMVLVASQNFKIESEANDFGLRVGEKWVDEQCAFSGHPPV